MSVDVFEILFCNIIFKCLRNLKKIIIQKIWLIDLLCIVYIINFVNIYKYVNMFVNVMLIFDLF